MAAKGGLLRTGATFVIASLRDRGLGYTLRAIRWRLQLAADYRRFLERRAREADGSAASRRLESHRDRNTSPGDALAGEDRAKHAAAQCTPSSDVAPGPLISVLLPVYNAPEAFLRAAIESVRAQRYPRWELCIADDASTAPHVRPILEGYAAADPRIRVVFRPENGHISRASNSALELAEGEYVALLDHDDLLTADALLEVAQLLARAPETDMIYSDEDKIDGSGRRFDPFFKPAWSPESLLARNYVCHLGVYRRSLLSAIGGFREGLEGSQDYDLALRFTERTDRVRHISKVLYHWRVHASSAAAGDQSKPYAYVAGETAVADALARRGLRGSVTAAPGFLGIHHIRLQAQPSLKVSVVIDAASDAAALDRCLHDLQQHAGEAKIELLLVAPSPAGRVAGADSSTTKNGPPESESRARRAAADPHRERWVTCDEAATVARRLNVAAAAAEGDLLLFLDPRLLPPAEDWIGELAAQAQRDGIGAAGPLLLARERRIYSAGIVTGVGGSFAHILQGAKYPAPHHANYCLCLNNVSAVSAQCLMIRRAVFESAHGFDEAFVTSGYDVDLGLRLRAAGLRNVHLPHVALTFPARLSTLAQRERAAAGVRQAADIARLRRKHALEDDPYYHPHFNRRRADFRLRLDADADAGLRSDRDV